MQVQLISEDVQFEDVQFTLAQDPVVLGRSVRADVQVMHPLISRLHCEWALVDGELQLKDLGSTNQTIVNGETIQHASLQTGDRLMLGDVTFIVEILEESAPSRPGSTADFQNPLDLLEADVNPNHQSEMPTERMIVDDIPSQTLTGNPLQEPINE